MKVFKLSYYNEYKCGDGWGGDGGVLRWAGVPAGVLSGSFY